MSSPFESLLEHAEKVKECVWAFQQAIECYATEKCQEFNIYRQEVAKLESEADAIKRSIRGHIPIGTRMPVTKFELLWYIREQDKVLDSVQESLDWMSYRTVLTEHEELIKQLYILVDSVIEPIEDLSRMVTEAKKYFNSYAERQRNIVKGIIQNIRKREHGADAVEDEFKTKIFVLEKDPIAIFHMVRLAESIGSIADHAENAGDMMRSMIAKRKRLFFRKS
jgi:predicted phosphate transport protein (TIGR00153 family)